MKNNEPIFVTQPTLPPLEKFIPYLKQIWNNKRLTNNGTFHQQFEEELCKYLGVKHISLFANGTLALVIALQALRITGEVITTPYSFVATTHALWWNNIKPVFVDIEPEFCNLDPKKIIAAITPKTTAILPVHVYGNPCDVVTIREIADEHGLKVIYDAAHAFRVKKEGVSILNHGDLSILSFHATKVFSTCEGGAIVCHNEKMKRHIDDLKNFGFRGETTVVASGLNAKMNEIQAALGLLQLKYVNNNIARRKEIAGIYRERLNGIHGISFLHDMDDVDHNYAYFPIFVNGKKYGMSRDQLYEKLKQHNIFARRYFYPLISEFPMYKRLNSANPANLVVATKMAQEVICVPTYADLDIKYINRTVDVINKENW